MVKGVIPEKRRKFLIFDDNSTKSRAATDGRNTKSYYIIVGFIVGTNPEMPRVCMNMSKFLFPRTDLDVFQREYDSKFSAWSTTNEED